MTLERSRAFAGLLRGYRRAAGLTQEELAERARLSARALRKLESGASQAPRRDTIALLADALALSSADREAFVAAVREARAASITSSIAPVSFPAVPLPRPSASTGGSPPLVGRAPELAHLEHHLAGAGAPALMLLGEPGIGKSRLLREVAERVAARGWTVLSGGCHRRSGQEPYAPIAAMLVRFLAAHTTREQRRLLHGCAWLVRLLPELLETAVVPAPSWQLPPDQERRLMFAATQRLLRNVAGPAGTLLLLDDLHWAGADALDLLAFLLRESLAADRPDPTNRPRQRVRVVGAYRDTDLAPEDARGLQLGDLAREGLAAHLWLAPLSRQESVNLLSCLLADADATVAPPAPAVQEDVLARSDGVPFFLVSCAQQLRVGGWPPSQADGTGGTSGTQGADVSGVVPWRVAHSIRARVAPLPKAAQEVLAVAAVAGRQTSYRVLLAAAQTATLDEAGVVAALDAVCRAQLLADPGDGAYPGNGSYAFTHDLIREVLVADLSIARRALLHQRIAEGLEGWPQAERERRAAELAWHFAEGGMPARALPYALAAGDAAAAMYACAEAERHYRSAAEMARKLGAVAREAEAQEKLGGILTTAARYTEALATLAAALACYERLDDTTARARVAARLGLAHSLRGTPTEGIEQIQQQLALLETAHVADAALVEVLLALAVLHRSCGRYGDQLCVAERAVALARTAGDDRLLAQAEFRRGTALLMMERNGEGMEVLERVLPALEAIGDLRNLVQALNNLAVAHETQEGDFALARRYVERAVGGAERLGDPVLLAFMVSRRGTNAFDTGDWPLARADLERAVLLVQAADGPGAALYPLLRLARLDVAQGRLQQAAGLHNRARVIAEQTGDVQALRSLYDVISEVDLLNGRPERAHAEISMLLERANSEDQVFAVLPKLAWAALELGNPDEAAGLAARAIARAHLLGNTVVLADGLRAHALVLMHEQRWQEAVEALEQALAIYQTASVPYSEAKALFVYGQLAAAQGSPEQARARYQAALAICERLGEGLYRPHIERALIALPGA